MRLTDAKSLNEHRVDVIKTGSLIVCRLVSSSRRLQSFVALNISEKDVELRALFVIADASITYPATALVLTTIGTLYIPQKTKFFYFER